MDKLDNASDHEESRNSSRPHSIRVWPAVVLLVAFWTFLIAHYTVEMAMFTRFISRFSALGILLLFFLLWWFTNRGIAWRDRFLGFGVLVASWLTMGSLADRSVGLPGALISGLPFCFTAWVAWILVSRKLSLGAQRAGFLAVTLLAFGFFALVRWEGLDGAQRTQLAWRWTPTAEQLFLEDLKTASHDSEADASGAAHSDHATESWAPRSGDWPEFRGPDRAGVVRGVTIETDWDKNPPREVWRHRIGPGWSSMIVVDGHLVTQEQRDDREAVVSYNAVTGAEEWVHTDETRFEEGLSGAGPRSTPTFHDGRLYAFGATGLLNCLEAATGKLIWSHDLVAEAGGEAPQWGYAVSPLVVDDLVIVFTGGKQGRGLVAYGVDDGAEIWSRAGGTLSYSSPQIVTLGGRRQLLMHDNQKLAAYDVADGTTLWERPTASEMALPMIQAHPVADDALLITSDPGIALVDVKLTDAEWSVNERWQSNRLKPSFNDFVIHDDHIYGLDDGILCCLDLESGERLWKRGRYGHGQILLLADRGMLLVMGEKGEVVLVEANSNKHEEIGRFQAIEGKTWNHPVLAHGRLYVRNGEEIACYEIGTENEKSIASRRPLPGR